MIPRPSLRSGLSVCAMLLAFGLEASAQTVTTVPVGAVAYSFTQGSQLVGLSLVKNTVAAAEITNIAGATVAVSHTNIGALLVSGAAYYIEVINDPVNAAAYEGDRIEIDTAATIAANNNTIALRAVAENTVSPSLPAGLVGAKLAIRRHYTLGGLLTDLPGAFIAGDKITIRRDGNSYVTATLNGVATAWLAGFTNLNSVVIYPGVGFFLVRASATATSGVLVGDLRNNNFVQILSSGNQVLAEGYPVDSAPAPLISAPTEGGVPNRLFTNLSGGTFLSGDKLAAYNDVNQLVTYTYNASTNRWAAGFTNGNVIKLFKANRANYLTVASPNQNYVQIKPFSL